MASNKIKTFTVVFIISVFFGLTIFQKEKIKEYLYSFANENLDFKLKKIKYEQDNRFCFDIKNLDLFEKYLNTDLFTIPIEKEKDNLKLIECLQSVAISRVIPDTIIVKTTEKKPIAIWQNNKKYHFITEDKEVINIYNTTNIEGFLILTGKSANIAVEDLFKIIDVDPEMKQHISSAIFIGERRWNIRFKNGLEVKLPENDPIDAWKKFLFLTKQKDLLGEKAQIKSFDFRIKNKLITQQ